MARPELFDLHVHSVRSDGLHSLLQLAHLARLSGLSGLAITDHDVLPDPAAMADAARLATVEMLPGVELSCEWEGRGLHLLGYGFKPTNVDLQSACLDLQANRRRRCSAMVAKLRSAGIRLSDDRLFGPAAPPAIGRMHLARELIRAGKAGSPKAAFQRYLIGLDNAVAFERLPLDAAIRLLHAAEGRAVIAHPPPKLTEPDWDRLCALGIDGLECDFPAATSTARTRLRQLATARNLLKTAGSDFHGGDGMAYLGRCTVDRPTMQAACVGSSTANT